tara:strand:+ start:385 stop:507 length:123 start_codon:yes stop_codon:yes gene_type:complete
VVHSGGPIALVKKDIGYWVVGGGVGGGWSVAETLPLVEAG